MMKSIFVTLAAITMSTAAGCSMLGVDDSTPARQPYHNANAPASDLVVVPTASTVADLSKPEVSVTGDSVLVTGIVRLRTGQINPDATIRIVVIDKYGREGDEINAKLKETDNLGVLSYRANFGPAPAKGSSLAVSYEDWHPVTDYSAGAIGSGGGGSNDPNGKSAVSGPSINTAQGSKTTKSRSSVGGSGGPKLSGISSPRSPH